ncbi:MAG: heme ABC exporter ATP-binding protein CcmA [Planctomycetales bacterium]|nr:heme ABC exporter ATP-binding protein CcmA [Planctomycetales bacterium]
MIPLEARQLGVAYNQRLVLRSVDLQIGPGEAVALIGTNGVGKTTLLHCLAGLQPCTAGEVRWFGESSLGQANANRSVGLIAHQRFLYPELTPRENLLFAARMYGLASPQKKVATSLRYAGLDEWQHQPTATLSHGLRQRLAVSRGLLHAPRIALFDEPFSGLDENSRQWMSQILHELRSRETAVCFTTHDQNRADSLADRVLEIVAGRLSERESGQSGPSSMHAFRPGLHPHNERAAA